MENRTNQQSEKEIQTIYSFQCQVITAYTSVTVTVR